MSHRFCSRDEALIFLDALREPLKTVAKRWHCSMNTVTRIVAGRKGHLLAQRQRMARERELGINTNRSPSRSAAMREAWRERRKRPGGIWHRTKRS